MRFFSLLASTPLRGPAEGGGRKSFFSFFFKQQRRLYDKWAVQRVKATKKNHFYTEKKWYNTRIISTIYIVVNIRKKKEKKEWETKISILRARRSFYNILLRNEVIHRSRAILFNTNYDNFIFYSKIMRTNRLWKSVSMTYKIVCFWIRCTSKISYLKTLNSLPSIFSKRYLKVKNNIASFFIFVFIFVTLLFYTADLIKNTVLIFKFHIFHMYSTVHIYSNPFFFHL